MGSGAWGTALALALMKNEHNVVLWTHRRDYAEQMTATRRNPKLPDAILPEELELSNSFDCVADCDMVLIACPSFGVADVCQGFAPFLKENAVVVSVTKGITPGSYLRMSQLAEGIVGRPVVALTGPSHAEEVFQQLPTACVAACENRSFAEFVQEAFISDTFRIYTSPDVVGAELGGALKNVIALCAGIADGMGYGDNTKAMLITRGLTEIARLGVAMGAKKETFAGLTGVGDLIVTCASGHSRNRKAGFYIGQGLTPRQSMEQVGAVVEGYYAAKSAWELAQKLGVDMPIVHSAYSILYEGVDAKTAVSRLLQRPKRAEIEDAGWQ